MDLAAGMAAGTGAPAGRAGTAGAAAGRAATPEGLAGTDVRAAGSGVFAAAAPPPFAGTAPFGWSAAAGTGVSGFVCVAPSSRKLFSSSSTCLCQSVNRIVKNLSRSLTPLLPPGVRRPASRRRDSGTCSARARPLSRPSAVSHDPRKQRRARTALISAYENLSPDPSRSGTRVPDV